MKHNFARLAVLLLALCLVLTGCNLIEVDPIMQLDEDMAALKEKLAVPVATYDGGTITKGDVMGSFNSQYSYYYQMYSMFGMELDNETLNDMLKTTVENAVTTKAVEAKFDELGLSLTDEEMTTVETESADYYQQAYDQYASGLTTKDEALKEKQVEYSLFADGFTKESFYNESLANAKITKVEEVIEGEITEVTEEELQAAYDEKVSADEETYTDDPGSLASAMTSEDSQAYWIPEGYRTVKHILVKPEEEVLQAVTDARTALSDAKDSISDYQDELADLNDDDAEDTEEAEATRTAEEIQADIDAAEAMLPQLEADVTAAESACLASVQEKTDAIYARLEAGEDFDAVMAEVGEDPGMQSEPAMTTGYYVSADCTTWDANFTSGSMLLANVGDVSEPVISTSGVHIIKYVSDVASGAIALDDVRDALYEETLTTMKQQHFSDTVTGWTEALNPQYTIEAFYAE